MIFMIRGGNMITCGRRHGIKEEGIYFIFDMQCVDTTEDLGIMSSGMGCPNPWESEQKTSKLVITQTSARLL